MLRAATVQLQVSGGLSVQGLSVQGLGIQGLGKVSLGSLFWRLPMMYSGLRLVFRKSGYVDGYAFELKV